MAAEPNPREPRPSPNPAAGPRQIPQRPELSEVVRNVPERGVFVGPARPTESRTAVVVTRLGQFEAGGWDG